VQIDGDSNEARRLASKHGFVNQGKVSKSRLLEVVANVVRYKYEQFTLSPEETRRSEIGPDSGEWVVNNAVKSALVLD